MKSYLSKLQHNYYEILKVVLFLLAILIVVWVSPKESFFKYEFQVNKPWKHQDLIAPFDFGVLKTNDKLAEEQEQVTQAFYPYFYFDEGLTADGEARLFDLFGLDGSFKIGEDLIPDSIPELIFLKGVYEDIQQTGILQYDPVLSGQDDGFRIRLIRGREVQEITLGQLYTIRAANSHAKDLIATSQLEDSALLTQIISKTLVQNVFYDAERSKAELNSLLSGISPSHGLVQKGELIISTGELVSPQKYQVLFSLKTEYEKELGSPDAWIYIYIGIILIITLLFTLQYLFFSLYKRALYAELKNVILVLLSQVLMIIIADFIFYNYPQWTYIIPFAILPVIIVAFLDTDIAIIVHLVTVMLLGFFAPNSFEFFYTQFAAGIIAVFSIKKLTKRADLFRTSLFVFLTLGVVYLSMLLVQDGSLDNFETKLVINLAGSAALILLAFPIIFVYEKLFGVLTHLSLLELSNTNNPLLRDLASKAPGTFQHSLQVANLASEALYEIGGDSLLARTGALYHDIGKMNNPGYFVENQMPGHNPHDEISYEESARIIIDHVLSGIEMARKARLPEQIIDFIRTHHGNRRVEYFYRLERKLNPGMEVDQSEFTYHGPVPFSKETAVVMMADSVEAASRSILQPNEQKINDLVDNIVQSLMDDGQFMNASITLKEITKVKKVLKKKLMNINHIRIAYPD